MSNSTLPSCSAYRLLVEHAPVMVWRSGVDAKCDYFNETWLAFSGRTLEQELGDGWAEGVHPDDLNRCIDHYLFHFHRREAFEMDYRLRRYDGAYRWILDRGVPFANDDGEFGGFIGSCVDIEDRRRGEELQKLQTQEERSLSRDFERRILAIVSHDIRDPLNAIGLAAQHIQKYSDPVGPLKRSADVVTRGVSRIQHIVGDLLDLSREREGEGIPIQPRPIDLRIICHQIIDELQPAATSRTIVFECETDGKAFGDEHRILQAVSNLASNAIQHGTPGTDILVRLIGNERKIAVEITNAGTIPANVMARIFEPFRSGRHETKRGDGLGLGIFIARAIARAHKGDLQVECVSGTTTFRLELPRRRPA